MKSLLLVTIFFLLTEPLFSQEWTDEEKESANTAQDIAGLNSVEKEVIMYINLCRMYPESFADNEVETYNGIPGIKDKAFKKYKASLLKDLRNREACDPLEAAKPLIDDAKCFANELSKSNRVGHKRSICRERKYAECLSFGSMTARQIVLEWLIDSGIATLGHRKNCLNSNYNRSGISIAPHASYGSCAVAEFGE